MIEIRKLTNRNLDAIAQWHYDNLSKTLNRRLNSRTYNKYKNATQWLKNNLKEIITAKPKQLEKLYSDFDILIRAKKCKTFFTEKALPKIFDYGAFTKNKVAAYTLAKKLNVKTCPYCNRNYTVTVEKIVAKKTTHIVRPDFDHFLAKSKYPLLALSFYNLIPCCSLCNSRIKGDFKMELKKHIHPYVEGFDDSLHFSFNPKDAESLYGLSHNLDITIKNQKNSKGNRSKRNAKLFKLEEIYNLSHTDEVADIIRKFHISGGRYLQILARQFPQLGTVEELYKIAFANYYTAADFEKRPLSKLTKDIFDQLKFTLPV